MIIDAKLEMSDNQTLPNDTAVDSTNVCDLGDQVLVKGRDAFGNAKKPAMLDMGWFVNVQEVMVGAGNCKCELVSSAVATLDSVVVHATLNLLTISAAGMKKFMKVTSVDFLRYVGVIYTADGAITAGKVNSGLILGYNDSMIADKI